MCLSHFSPRRMFCEVSGGSLCGFLCANEEDKNARSLTLTHTHTVSCCCGPPLSPPSLCTVYLWRQRSHTTMCRLKRGFFLFSLWSLLVPLQVYMTLQLFSTQALEFCSAASVWVHKEALLPGSQLRDARFRSLRRTGLSNGIRHSLLTDHVKATGPRQQHFAAACRNIFLNKQNTYLRKDGLDVSAVHWLVIRKKGGGGKLSKLVLECLLVIYIL